jgi:hypothetical protein
MTSKINFDVCNFWNTFPSSMIIIDINWKIIKFNKNFCKLLRYSSSELKKKHLKDILSKSSWDDLYIRLNKIKNEEEDVYVSEKVFLSKDKENIRTIVLVAPIFDNNRKVALIFGILTDISPFKFSNEEKEIIFNNPTFMVFRINKEKIIEQTTGSSKIILGFFKENLINKNILNLSHQLDKKIIEEEFNKLNIYKSIKFDARIKHTDGSYRWINFNIFKTNDHNKFIAIARDITSKKIFHEQMKVYYEELKKSNQELYSFANFISHDLKEPLRKILFFSDKIISESSEINEKTRKNIGLIKNSADKIRNLIKGISKLCKMSIDLIDFKYHNINDIINSSINLLSLKINETNSKIVIKNNIDFDIECDKNILEQLFVNILDNSMKFKKDNENLIINITINKKLDDYVKISIKDNGIGFDGRFRNKVFSMFQKCHDGLYQGNGIGLFMCKKIVEFHNGKINIFSKINKGTTVNILIPIKQYKFLSYN